MSQPHIERREIHDFSLSIEAEAARNLNLLNAIESTLAWLTRLTAQLKADISFGESLSTELAAQGDPIDLDGALADHLHAAQQGMEALYDVLLHKRQAGRDDHHLSPDDGIEEAYTEAIAAAADLHNLLNALRWAMGEHDIDAAPQPPSKTYAAQNIDQMFDDLLSS